MEEIVKRKIITGYTDMHGRGFVDRGDHPGGRGESHAPAASGAVEDDSD